MTALQEPPSGKILRLDAAALSAFLDEVFPAALRPGFGDIISVAPGYVRITLSPGPETLRPGKIVSGPTQMALVDGAAYAVVAAHIGKVAMAVTNTLSINFLRACRQETIYADARLLKLGRRLALVDVRLWQGTEDRLVAQASVGYALPI